MPVCLVSELVQPSFTHTGGQFCASVPRSFESAFARCVFASLCVREVNRNLLASADNEFVVTYRALALRCFVAKRLNVNRRSAHVVSRVGKLFLWCIQRLNLEILNRFDCVSCVVSHVMLHAIFGSHMAFPRRAYQSRLNKSNEPWFPSVRQLQ
jgi:hypothetical protein